MRPASLRTIEITEVNNAGAHTTGTTTASPSPRYKLINRQIRTFCIFATAVLALGCDSDVPQIDPGQTVNTFDAQWWSPMVTVLVERLELVPGERVFAVGRPGLHQELPGLFAAAVEAAGGIYVGTLSAQGPYGRDGDVTFVERARGADRGELRELLRDVPVGIMLPGPTPADPPYAAMQDLLWEQLGQHRTVHFHWAGAYTVEDRSYPIGSTAGAVPTDGDREASLYRRAILEQDFSELRSRHDAFEQAARAGEIHVTTAAGTDIRFRIGARPINRQDGDVSGARAAAGAILIDREIEFPAGAVRVAPIETSVHGVVVFPRSTWSGETVDDLRFVFAEGVIISLTAGTNLRAVEAELAAEGARSFREFGLGFNTLLAVPTEDPWLPYFGYGAGVVRLSLGDNSEIGGNVESNYVRWNFFLDATVSINGETWVEDGRLVRF